MTTYETANDNKFRLFSNRELTELVNTFQACRRDNKMSHDLFAALEIELESRFSGDKKTTK
jgi:hypothetical protein